MPPLLEYSRSDAWSGMTGHWNHSLNGIVNMKKFVGYKNLLLQYTCRPYVANFLNVNTAAVSLQPEYSI